MYAPVKAAVFANQYEYSSTWTIIRYLNRIPIVAAKVR